MSDLTTQDRGYLLNFLTKKFNLEELKTLAFIAGYPFEDYPHNTKSAFAREMLQYYLREERLGALLQLVLKERPDRQLAEIYARQPAPATRVKVELVIRNAVKENAQDIQRRIAEAMGWQQDDVGIIMAVAGSLKLLLSVPAGKVPELLTLAEDPQAWLPYVVESITPYAQLPLPQQQGWQETVVQNAPPQITTPLPPPKGGGLTAGKALIFVLVGVGIVAAVIIGFLVLSSPRVEIINACGRPIGIPPDVPVIGGQEIMPEASFGAPLPTGTYRYRYDGHMVEIESNGQRFGWPIGPVGVLVNGRFMEPGVPDRVVARRGDTITIEIIGCE